MKSVTDFIKSITEEGEAAVNTVSGGAIASKDVPLGGAAKRKPLKESDAYEGPNALADCVGKTPLLNAGAVEAEKEQRHGTPEDAEEGKKHHFHISQEKQSNF